MCLRFMLGCVSCCYVLSTTPGALSDASLRRRRPVMLRGFLGSYLSSQTVCVCVCVFVCRACYVRPGHVGCKRQLGEGAQLCWSGLLVTCMCDCLWLLSVTVGVPVLVLCSGLGHALYCGMFPVTCLCEIVMPTAFLDVVFVLVSDLKSVGYA